MPQYRITIRDDEPLPCEASESHADLKTAHQSAIRSAVDILMDGEPLDGPRIANISVRDEATNVTRLIRVAVLVSHTFQREEDQGAAGGGRDR